MLFSCLLFRVVCVHCVRCELSVDGCMLIVVCSVLRCVLLFVGCSWFMVNRVRYVLFGVCCSLVVVRCSFFVDCYPWLVVCCLLSVAW